MREKYVFDSDGAFSSGKGISRYTVIGGTQWSDLY